MTDTSGFAADIAALPVQEPNRGPLLGTQPGPVIPPTDPADIKFTGPRPSGPTTTPVYDDTVFGVINQLDPVEHGWLAIDMFLNAPGAYSSIDNVFDEKTGELDLRYFQKALNNTLSLAAEYGPDKYGSGTGDNSEYLKILLGDTNRGPGELLAEFAALKEKHDAEKSSGQGRIINYIDPVALASAAKDAFSSVTGRRATAAEQKSFVKQIHGLQASGATGVAVGARAEQFASDSSPVEAKGMQYSQAAGALMKAMGM